MLSAVRNIAIALFIAAGTLTASAQTAPAPKCPAFITNYSATDIVKMQLVSAQFRNADLVYVPDTSSSKVQAAQSKYGVSGLRVITACNGAVYVFLDVVPNGSNNKKIETVYDRLAAFFINVVTSGALRPVDILDVYDAPL